MNKTPPPPVGESILEILLAVAIFAIVLPAILYTMGSLASSQPGRNIFFDALVLTEETKNTIQQIKSTGWESVSHNGEYTLTADTLIPLTTTPTPDPKGIIRTIEISEVRRNGNLIVAQGGIVDNATKKVSIHISWENSQEPITTDFYITRSDGFGSFTVTNTSDFTQGTVLLGGTKVTSSGVGEDGEITLDTGDPETEIGLQSWWKMSGEYAGSQAEIDAAPGGTNNLRIFGSPSFGAGRFNKKVTLDSNNKYMVASSSASLELAGQMSIIAWVKATTMPINATIIHKITSAGAGYRLGVNDAGNVIAEVGNLGVGTTALTAKNTNKSILGGLWHQTACTYDGSKLLVYVDGLQGEMVGDGVSSLATNTEPLYIGKNPSYTDGNFTGEIDDVQVYNIALTASEIQKLLYSTYTSSPKNYGKAMMFHSMGATIYQPSDTKIGIQVAVAAPVAGTCDNAAYSFVGNDGTETSFFNTDQVGATSIASVLPGSSENGQFSNPGQCLRWKAYLYSAKNQGSDDPSLKDIHFTYSQ